MNNIDFIFWESYTAHSTRNKLALNAMSWQKLEVLSRLLHPLQWSNWKTSVIAAPKNKSVPSPQPGGSCPAPDLNHIMYIHCGQSCILKTNVIKLKELIIVSLVELCIFHFS